jgi:hypothetical protein
MKNVMTKIDFTEKPQITISLPLHLEAFCRFTFKTPDEQKEIIITRNHDIGRLIHSNINTSDLPMKSPCIPNRVIFILPVNKINHHGITSHFLKVSSWGEQKIVDGIEYEYRKWVERCFEIGYQKKWEQKEIIEAILRGLNIRNNVANYDAVKKNDYRMRKKLDEKRFTELLNADYQ